MSLDFEDIQELRFDTEGQVEWWQANGSNLGTDEREELFDWLVEQDKFAYLNMVIEVTLFDIGDIDKFTQDLDRIAPHIDGDLAWAMLYDEYRDRLQGQPELAEEIYQRLIREENDWLVWMAGVALGHLSEDVVHEKFLSLLAEDEQKVVRAGIQAIIEQYQGREVPDVHVQALSEIIDREEHELLREVLRANAVLFLESDALWDLTVRIGRKFPETIPYIAEHFAGKIEKRHLKEFLSLLEWGLKLNESVNTSRVSYFLHSRFSDQNEILSDYIISLSEHDLYEAGRLASEITKENTAFLSYLNGRRDDFRNKFFAEQVISESKEYVDPEISELARLLENAYEETNPQKKGDFLEDAAEHLINLVDAFEPARNVFSTEEEIDVLVHNRADTHILRWDTPILIECRNRSKKVQAKHIRDFEGKLWNHNADTGFVISRSGFTDGAVTQVKQCRAPGRGKMIGMVDMDELLDLTETDEIISLLTGKYDEINEL